MNYAEQKKFGTGYASESIGVGTALDAGMMDKAARTRSEMEQEVNRLGHAIEIAHSQLNEMAERLVPILSDAREEKANGAATPEPMPASPLCEQIRNLSQSAESLSGRLAILKMRLSI